jgi:hypothetical protein
LSHVEEREPFRTLSARADIPQLKKKTELEWDICSCNQTTFPQMKMKMKKH